jgi:GT2 family glycosyltransferase
MRGRASDVSIVVVNWNGRHHLRELLPSLSILHAAEILVVDNGSSDGSQQFVRSTFPSVRLLENPANCGFAHPSNRGAMSAKGRYVAFINNDAKAHPDWLQAALDGIGPDCPCVASRILDWTGDRIDYNGSSLQYLGYALQRDIGRLVKEVSSQDRVLFPCGGAMLIDRQVFLDVGGFDEDYFAIFEDVDLGWRLWILGYEVGFAPDSIAFHKGHATLSRHAGEKMRYLMHRNALMTIAKNYEETNYRRVFPLALIMAIKRAVIFSGVEKEAFYLWSKTEERIKAGDDIKAQQLMDALNHVVSVDDVLESLPMLLEKRRRIQQRRKRSDQELFSLFVDPLRPIVEDARYIEQELSYLAHLDLEQLLDVSEYRSHLRELPRHLEERIDGLRSQLKGWQWIGTNAMSHPPAVGRSSFRKLARLCRSEGFSGVWRHLSAYLNRGR